MLKNKFNLTIVCLAVILFYGNMVTAEMGPPVSTEKTLIGWGVNAVDSAYLSEHVRELEEEYDLDGMVITLQPDEWKGSKFQAWALFGGHKYKRDDFKQLLIDLKSIRFQRFTDNFLYVSTSVRGVSQKEFGNLDWFDGNWDIIADNMALFAEIAREVGFKGLMIDFEHYKGSLPLTNYFDYRTFVDYRSKFGQHIPSYREYIKQVKKRGEEMMKAITAIYPNITIIIIPYTGWPEPSGTGLVSSFVDGMLEGSSQEATLVDGGESGYPLQTYNDFMYLRSAARKKGSKISQAPLLLKKNMKYGFGVWLDYRPNNYGGWHTDPNDLDKNFRSPSRMEHTLYNALTATDKYVWLYVWHPEYWWNPESRLTENLHKQQQNQCQLCPHSVMPKEYTAVFKNCRKSHDLNWRP